MTIRETIIAALNSLGGEASLSEITETALALGAKSKAKDFNSVVRNEIERHSSDSAAYNGKEDVFYSVEGIGKGVWGLREPKLTETNMDITQDDESFSEGKKLIKQHIVRERNHALIEKAKRKFKKEHGGRLYCEICGFDFEKVYGELGKEFIEAHHIKPVSSMSSGEKTRVEDLIMVCPNCHSMIHRKKPWLTRKEITKIIKTI